MICKDETSKFIKWKQPLCRFQNFGRLFERELLALPSRFQQGVTDSMNSDRIYSPRKKLDFFNSHLFQDLTQSLVGSSVSLVFDLCARCFYNYSQRGVVLHQWSKRTVVRRCQTESISSHIVKPYPTSYLQRSSF